MELISNGAIREGAHYQCVFYGGRLLAHLSASDPTVDVDDVVRILRVNRNAILIVDSDMATSKQQINSTKQRLLDEIKALEGIAWLTAGREVENYIPNSVIAALYPKADLTHQTRYSDFVDTLEAIKKGEGKRFARNKVLFAETVLPHLTVENLQTVLDWKDKASDAVIRIQTWNGLVRAAERQ
jgi:putative ATP-dependent endonuclease of the OLD family